MVKEGWAEHPKWSFLPHNFQSTKDEDVDDVTGEPLIQRKDDNQRQLRRVCKLSSKDKPTY